MALIRLDEPRLLPKTPPTGFALFALGFRPFYLLGALFAAFAVPLWIVLLAGKTPLMPVLPAMLWHGHEMLFGFVAAIVSGFLLTAGHNWTGLATPSGKPLAALAALWLAGRLLMFCGMPVLAAAVDIAFLPAVGAIMARLLLRAGSRRNYFIPILLFALAAANAALHAGAHGWLAVSPLVALHLAVALIVVLETVIAGRIVPSFTANALKTAPWRNVWVDRAAIALTGLALAGWALDLPAGATGIVACLAAATQAVRMWGWRPLPTLGTPLLSILHVSHGWIVVALLWLGAAGIGLAGPAPTLHMLTIGATGGLIVGMITRTALGHSGRLLKAGATEVACYGLLQLALVLRVLPLLGGSSLPYTPFLHASATAWSACFILYLWKYAPILIRPRVDGRPG